MFGRAVLFAVLLMSMVSCDFFMGLLGLNSGFAANVILVEDNISTTVIWDAAKVYYLDSSIEVSSGASLTIPAGTVIKFNVDGALLVADGATLNAIGTAENPIVFTSIKDDSAGGDSALDGITTTAAAKDWRGTWLLTGSVASFSYCNFRYAGAGDCAALYLDGRATVSYCTFSDNDGGLPSGVGEAALDAHAAATGTIITNNVFYNNYWPLAVSSNYNLGSTNTFSYTSGGTTSKNSFQAIFLGGDEINGTIVWDEAELPFVSYHGSQMEVAAGGSLTLGSGVVVKFCGSSSGITIVDGGSFVPGNAIFTDFRDDTRGGDSNADATATSPVDASWYGVYNNNTDAYYTANVFYAANY